MTHPAIATTGRVAALKADWPDHVRLSFSDLPVTPRQDSAIPVDPNIYGYHPYLFAGAFPGVGEQELAHLSVAACLFASAIFAVDRGVDGDRVDPNRGQIDLLASQFEAYRALSRLFSGCSPFWDVLRARLADYATVVREQAGFVSGKRALTDFSYELAVESAKAKTSLAMVTVAALGELAGMPGPVEALTRSIQAYSVATQLLDDVRDWRDDLAGGRPSYPLAQAVVAAELSAPPEGHPTAEQTDQIGRALYFRGVAARIADLAADQLAEARTAVSGLGVDEWLAHLGQVAATALVLRAQVTGGTPRTSRPQPASPIRFAVSRHRPWQYLAGQSLRWLLGQWRLGFPDANHIMSFPGFPDPGPHIGNVFSRALIANVLVEANRSLAQGQLDPCLDAEVDHLLANRRLGEPGLWAYFPTLTELACDGDDLAEVLRLLTSTGRAQEVTAELATALTVAFHDCGHPDGSFRTWLVPPAETAEWAVRQATAARELWGEGADSEVVANLLHAVAQYAPRRYRDALDQGVTYLLGAQTVGGWWTSGWYHGWLYGTYQCLRTIRLLRPDAVDPVSRAHDHVLASQNHDGGWANTGEHSDPLGTALALLALAQAQEHGTGRAEERAEAARRARDWLVANTGTDGSYGSEPFIAMSPQRSPGLGHQLGFGCPSITTALVCLAATTWARLS